jgi:hypothetical protein
MAINHLRTAFSLDHAEDGHILVVRGIEDDGVWNTARLQVFFYVVFATGIRAWLDSGTDKAIVGSVHPMRDITIPKTEQHKVLYVGGFSSVHESISLALLLRLSCCRIEVVLREERKNYGDAR